MSDQDVLERAEAAAAVARLAGARALAHFRDRATLVVESKENPQDVVSLADRDVEALIAAEIATAFPEDGLLGEETGLRAGSSGFLWVVDPIDGTSPFLHGMQYWCVSIAVVRDGQTVAGAICEPVAGTLYAARLGGGTTLDGAAVRLDPALGLRNGLTAIGASHRTPSADISAVVKALLDAGGMFFRHGSGALMLAQVATGRLAAYFEPHMHPWDCLAGLLMVREAGGWTAPYPGPGGLSAGGRVVAAGPGARAELDAVLAAVGV